MSANRCPNEKCDYFNRILPNSAKVCPWCGTPLGVVAPKPQPQPPQPRPQPTPQSTSTNIDYATEYQPRPPIEPTPSSPEVYSSSPTRLPILKLIHSSGREFQWSGETGFIGRRSQTMNVPPDIDLAGIEHEGIVSRRHARLSWDWSQSCYMIVDMSINGIYLNGTLLNPGSPYRLMNGDSLQFGQDNLVCFSVFIA